ncbi:hypothetical protein F5Y05DRAFT_290032 [Hypoxylon sp. FL0543]|nr:hypothetical protein F5Y05DRAFT_290032 [Hypoxylon sp. FL0543]
MELTPIKIPGKRRSAADTVIIRRRKKPRMGSESSRKEAPAQTHIPRLQCMPLEILEEIFYLSENINLPRSNPAIGSLLSGIRTRRDFFILAFRPNWKAYLGIPDGIFDDLDYPNEADPKLQSALLEESWVDITFILMCLDRFVQRVMKRLVAKGDQLCDRIIFLFPFIDPEKPSDLFWKDYAKLRQIEELSIDNFEFFVHRPVSIFRFTIRTRVFRLIHGETRVPDSLLVASAEDEGALQKLFWLVQSGARLSPEQTWEVTLPAFHHSVPKTFPHSGQVNMTAVKIFDMLGVFGEWPDHIIQEEIHRLDPNPECPIEDLNVCNVKSRYVAQRLRYHMMR